MKRARKADEDKDWVHSYGTIVGDRILCRVQILDDDLNEGEPITAIMPLTPRRLEQATSAKLCNFYRPRRYHKPLPRKARR